MRMKSYSTLPEEAVAIRKEVFMLEQGFCDEFDEIDKIATHVVCLEGEEAVAVCRVFFDQEHDSYVVGRIAVRRNYRGRNYGAKVLAFAEQKIIELGGTKVGLSAQQQAVGFYEKQGYGMQGEVYLDEGCPHVWMSKELMSK